MVEVLRVSERVGVIKMIRNDGLSEIYILRTKMSRSLKGMYGVLWTMKD